MGRVRESHQPNIREIAVAVVLNETAHERLERGR